MGHMNTQFTGPMIDLQTDPQRHSHMLPDPCIFYGNASNYPQPNIHAFTPAMGNRCNFNFRRMPEHHERTLFYGMPPYNGAQPQHPALSLDLAVAAPSAHYNPYLTTPSSGRDFPVRVNQSVHDPLYLSNNHVVGVPTDSYRRNIPFGDGARRSFKRSIIERSPANYLHHNPSGASSSAASMTGRSTESDITPMDVAPFMPSEYGGNDSAASMIDSGSHLSIRHRPGLVGPEYVMVHNATHLIQGNYVSPPVQMPVNPWLDMHFGANNNTVGGFTLTQAPDLSFVRGGVNGACVEMGNMGTQGYQVTSGNRSSNGFLPPPIPQGHHNPHHQPPLLQGVRGYNFNFPPHVASTSSHRISTVAGASNVSITSFQDAIDAAPAFGLQTGFRLYQPYQRESILDSNARHRNLPQLRVLPEDVTNLSPSILLSSHLALQFHSYILLLSLLASLSKNYELKEIAMLEIPGYLETGDPVDQHGDMRLDIDHMSYEELLALGEQIGSVGSGLTVEFIVRKLKNRTFSSSVTCFNLEEVASLNEQINFCVICQSDYEDGEMIGAPDCGHGYHQECIKKWLLVKNTCPICKSTALSSKGKGCK